MIMRHAPSLALLTTVVCSTAGCSGDKTPSADTAPTSATAPSESGGAAATSAPAAPAAARPSQQALPTMPALVLPDDPKRAEKITLGAALFFDKRLSGNKDISCYGCHQNEDGNGGRDKTAIGSGGKPLPRHSPVIWNVGYWKNAGYWDGRAKTLEANNKAAWAGAGMGVGGAAPEKVDENLEKKTAELAALPGYKALFEAAFPGEKPKHEHVVSSISEYMRTLVCNDTAYDKFAAGDKAALSEQQQRGLDVFMGKGRCMTCHAAPFFSTAMATDGGAYFNIGIGTQGVPEDKVDIGRMKVTSQAADWAAFKPPSLRNAKKSAPYFHDGSVATLDEAVALMAKGGIDNKNKSPLLVDTQLTDAERADLVAFLGALDCPGALKEPTLP